eukprot:m.200295 g.200295  ORF g.200295 m.200295 type:complete len:922 (+) comp15496_c0_seq1:56-2821(+)
MAQAGDDLEGGELKYLPRADDLDGFFGGDLEDGEPEVVANNERVPLLTVQQKCAEAERELAPLLESFLKRDSDELISHGDSKNKFVYRLGSVEEYIASCIEHTAAEFRLSITQNLPSGEARRGWRQRVSEGQYKTVSHLSESRDKSFVFTEMQRVGSARVAAWHNTGPVQDDPRENLRGLRGHVGIWNGSIVLMFGMHSQFACGCSLRNLTGQRECRNSDHKAIYRKLIDSATTKAEKSKLQSTPLDMPFLFGYKGFNIDRQFPDPDAKTDVFYDLGFCFDYFRLAISLGRLKKKQAALPLLPALLDPLARTGGVAVRKSQFDVKMHDDQRSILDGLTHNLELVQGPPGTGKSFCISEIARTREGSGVVLICAVQNRAINLIVEKLREFAQTLPFVVGGSPNNPTKNMGESAEFYSVLSQALREPEMTPFFKEIDAKEKEINECETRKDNLALARISHAQRKEDMQRLLKQRDTLVSELKQAEKRRDRRLKKVMERLVNQARVILVTSAEMLNVMEKNWPWKHIGVRSTPSSEDGRSPASARASADASGDDADPDAGGEDRVEPIEELLAADAEASAAPEYESRLIDALVMDESGLCPEFYGPLFAKLNPRQLILFGDVNQLPPFSNFDDMAAPASLMSRLQCALERRLPRAPGARAPPTPIKVPMLSVQFRMHDTICRLVSDIFYDSRLTTDARVKADRREFYQHSMNLQGPKWVGYDYVDSDKESTAEIAMLPSGFTNPHEVSMILSLVHALLFSGSLKAIPNIKEESTIFIIAFYAAQVSLFYETIYTRPEHTPLRQLCEAGQLRVLTVDSAQGTEADYVFVSCVRSNPEGKLGFLAAPRTGKNRVCVAMSRARVALVVFANNETILRRGVLKEAFDACTYTKLDELCSFTKLGMYAAVPPKAPPRALTYKQMEDDFM